MVFIERGQGTRVVGDHWGAFEPGEVFCFGPGLPHCFQLDRLHAGAASRVLQFRGEILSHLVTLPEMAGISRLLTDARQGLRFSRKIASRIESRLARLETTRRSARIVELLELLGDLAEDRAVESLMDERYRAGASAASSVRMREAWILLMATYDQTVSQTEIATRLGMSASALSRMFRRATGSTFSQTVINLRLAKVCRLLESNRDLTIAEASYESGFNNLSIFNRQFKAKFGLTPREWRRKTTDLPRFEAKS